MATASTGYVLKPMTAKKSANRLVNAMSVDVEEYFQVQALSGRIGRADWDQRESRVAYSTNRVLDLFAAGDVKATFFTLGWVGERHPNLIRRIVDEGHELASHGYAHYRVDRQTPDEFRDDIRRTKRILEDCGGVGIRGFRAATFSISRQTFWAYAIMAEEGYAYSSSVSPIVHDLYGIPDAPRRPFFPVGNDGVPEYPIATVRVAKRNWPCGGGGYFRLLPYGFSKWAIGRINQRDQIPAMFYFHPWEIDPDQPMETGLLLKSRLRHYTNLGIMADRLTRLVGDFAWDRVDRAFDA